MRKYLLDFSFDEITGETKILVDFYDDSMTTLELNEAIMEGEIRKEIIEKASAVFGENIAKSIENGTIALVCLDDHPEENTFIPILKQKVSSNDEIEKRAELI